MSVNIHSSGDLNAAADPEATKSGEHRATKSGEYHQKSGEHRPPPIPADALKADGKTNRERLEASANALRARLARTLESLDRRRHDALNIKVQAARHPVPLAIAGAGVAAVVGGTALVVYHVSRPPRSELGELAKRVRAVVRAWKNPRGVRHPEERSIISEVARGVAVSVASYAISQLAQNSLAKFFPALKKEEPPK